MLEYSNRNSVTFTFVSHEGKIEAESAILACSLKKYLGTTQEVLAMIPRIGNRILRPSPELLSLFKKLKIQTQVFNNSYIKFWQRRNLQNLISNKIFTFSTALNTDWTIFLDSDMVCINDIHWDPSPEYSMALKPVDFQAQIFWDKLFSLCSVPFPKQKTISTVDQILNVPYFNSGFIACKQEQVKLLYSTWLDLYQFLRRKKKMQKDLFPEFYADQVSLSIAIEKTGLIYHVLDESYNFPLHLRNAPLASNISIVHYHKPEFLIKSKRMSLIIKNLLDEFPELNKILNRHKDWQYLVK